MPWRLLIGVLVATCLCGCVTVVSPPAHPADPVSVYLADYGIHSSLVLARGTGGDVVEYSFGQWDWYALNHTEWYRLCDVMLIPTHGALGRREWKAPPTTETREPLSERMPVYSLYDLHVERAAAEALLARLDARFRSHLDTRVENDDYRLSLVRDDHLYWFGHACNAEVEDWLRELGCGVRAWSLVADFRIVQPSAPPGPAKP